METRSKNTGSISKPMIGRKDAKGQQVAERVLGEMITEAVRSNERAKSHQVVPSTMMPTKRQIQA